MSSDTEVTTTVEERVEIFTEEVTSYDSGSDYSEVSYGREPMSLKDLKRCLTDFDRQTLLKLVDEIYPELKEEPNLRRDEEVISKLQRDVTTLHLSRSQQIRHNMSESPTSALIALDELRIMPYPEFSRTTRNQDMLLALRWVDISKTATLTERLLVTFIRHMMDPIDY